MSTSDKFLLLRTHRSTRGLSDEAVREIADEAELVRFNAGDIVHQQNAVVTSLDLVVAGRLSVSMMDKHGNMTVRRFQPAGGQYGLLSAALGEPAGVQCIAEDPTTLLRLDYQVVLGLSSKYQPFRINLLRMAADGVKQFLYQRKHLVKPHMVAIFHEQPESRGLSRKLIERLNQLGENPCVLTDDPEYRPIEGLRYHLIPEGGQGAGEEAIRRQVSEWSDYERVIADVGTRLETDRATALLSSCDLVLWCVTPKSWKASLVKLKALQAYAPTWREKICLVWLLDREQAAPQASDLQTLVKRDIKLSLTPPALTQGCIVNNGFERLVHLLRGIQVGVALGGGGARGMAHLGVLKAFEQNGIIVDMIAGTSAGAMTGTLYASGMDVDHWVERFAADLKPSWLFRLLPGSEQWHLFNNFRRQRFDPMLRKYLQRYRLEQISVPMHTVTVDLISGETVVRERGDAVDAIVESINLPGLSLPILRDGQALVDGSVINTLPADVLVGKGCNFVIASSVTANLESEFASNRPDTPTAKMQHASTLQTLTRTYLVQSSRLDTLGVQSADFVIKPDVTRFDLSAFTRAQALAVVGEQATLEVISQIKESLLRLDPPLFASCEETS